MVHESKNVGDGCAASVTYQFPIPAPAKYWRTFFHRVRRTGDLAHCWSSIGNLAGAGQQLFRNGECWRCSRESAQ